MPSKIRDHIKDETISLKQQKENLRWLKRINKRFKTLSTVFKKRPLYISCWHCFEKCEQCSGKPKYIDVHIELPSLPTDYILYVIDYIKFCREFRKFLPLKDVLQFFRDRWIFTIENFKTYIEDKSPSDVHTDFFMLSNKNIKSIIARTDELVFARNIDRFKKILEKKPIIEFDQIYTSNDFFSKEDVLKFTKLWISKYYPKLAKREMIFKETKDEE